MESVDAVKVTEILSVQRRPLDQRYIERDIAKRGVETDTLKWGADIREATDEEEEGEVRGCKICGTLISRPKENENMGFTWQGECDGCTEMLCAIRGPDTMR